MGRPKFYTGDLTDGNCSGEELSQDGRMAANLVTRARKDNEGFIAVALLIE